MKDKASKGTVRLKDSFQGLFPKEIPCRLPPISRIEHQIDFTMVATLPNRVAHRPNLEESKEIQEQCDASNMSIGVVLLQEGHPITFFSEKLKGT
ncbi:hypothetical protein CR513_42578, partial [Mucuna pruriens]